MERDAWVFTFVASKGYVPADQRITAVLKYARARGLRLVTRPLREVVIAECCAALCPDCAAGLAVVCDGDLFWWHRQTGHRCGAEQLRSALKEQQRRAKDANDRERIAPVPQVPRDAVRRG